MFDSISRGSRNHYTVERIRFVRPDVAVGFVRARLLNRLGGAPPKTTTEPVTLPIPHSAGATGRAGSSHEAWR